MFSPTLKIILYGVIIGILIVAVLAALNVSPFNQIGTVLKNGLDAAGIDTALFSSVQEWASKNWMTLAATLGPVLVASSVALINNFRYKAELKARQQLAEYAQSEAIANLNLDNAVKSKDSLIDDLKSKLGMYEADTAKEQMQTIINELNSKNEHLLSQLQDLTDLKTLTTEDVAKVIEEKLKVP